jgi:predicted Rossmann fold flavoprotein
LIYDIIIIGAGPAGLFAAANVDKKTNSLILNNTNSPGKKLLISGAGQCNITNTGNIKDFVARYGDNGSKIRKVLYSFSNIALINYLESKGIECYRREDGKVFPKTMKGLELLNLLLSRGRNNGFKLINDVEIRNIQYDEKKKNYILKDDTGKLYKCQKLVIATGGLSYPKSGSNGSLIEAMKEMEIEIVSQREALVPIYIENYPYGSLSGIAFKKVKVSIGSHEKTGSLLFTHKNLSGPVILDMSRYAKNGEKIRINYLNDVTKEQMLEILTKAKSGCTRMAHNMIYDILIKISTDITKRYVEQLCQRAGVDENSRFADMKKEQMIKLTDLLTNDTYVVTGNGGYNVAMCTAGGVSLEEIDSSTFEVRKYPGMYIIGELLDIDGDTGGFNIQFAFSSGYICAKSLRGNEGFHGS